MIHRTQPRPGLIDQLNNRVALLEGGGSSTEPTFPTLSVSTLFRWRFSSDHVTLVNGRLTNIADMTGNGYDSNTMAGVERPRWYPKAFNGGYPAVLFDGAAHRITVPIPAPIAPPISVVSVIQDYTGGLSNSNLYRDSNSGAVGFSNGSGGTFRAFLGTVLDHPTSQTLQTTAPLLNGMTRHPTVRHDVFNGVSSRIRCNGVDVTGTTGANTPALSGTLNVGSDNTVNFYARVLMAEQVYFTGALTAADSDLLDAYYQELYGVVYV